MSGVTKCLVIVGTENVEGIINEYAKDVDIIYVICSVGQKSLVEDRARRIYAVETSWEKSNMWREAERVTRMLGESRYFIIFSDNYAVHNVDVKPTWDKNRIYYIDDNGKKVWLGVQLVSNAMTAGYQITRSSSIEWWFGFLVYVLGAELTHVNKEEVSKVDIVEESNNSEQSDKDSVITRVKRSLSARKIPYSDVKEENGEVIIYTDKEIDSEVIRKVEKKYGIRIRVKVMGGEE